jgi:glycerophosphoryl diester phosphodiesterase
MNFIDLSKAGLTFATLRRTWPQLLVTVFMTRIVAIVVLTPLVGLLLKAFLMTTATGVLTDEEILVFLIHPTGLAALLVVGTVMLAILFAEQGVLMVIGYGALEERRVTYLDAFRLVSIRWRNLLSLGGHLLIRLTLWTLPFLAGVAIVYLTLLDRYDINYYMARQPPEFLWALLIASLLGLALASILIKKASAWAIALPMVLFQSTPGNQALRLSAQATEGFRWRITQWILVYLSIVAVLSTLVTVIISLVGNAVVPRDTENLTLTAIGLGLVLLLSVAGNQFVAVMATVLFPLTVARFYDAIPAHQAHELDDTLPPSGSLGQTPSMRIPGRAILTVAIIALGATGLGAYLFSKSLESSPQVEIIAHRGASAHAPENTMAAFTRAITDGADWIELDVQEDADGVVVVQHDKDFMKSAGNSLKVWNATGTDLMDMDVGSFFDPSFAAERVPTLKDVLLRVKGKLGVLIELKYYGHDEKLEERVIEVVEETEMAGDIMVMSLKYDGVRKTAALRPDWRYGLLATVSMGDPTRLEVDFLAVNAAAASSKLIRDAHRRGMRVFVWTINDPVQMSVMISRGADGLITDEPALARQVLELREDLSPLARLVIWMAGETGLLQGLEEASPEGAA